MQPNGTHTHTQQTRATIKSTIVCAAPPQHSADELWHVFLGMVCSSTYCDSAGDRFLTDWQLGQSLHI